MNSFPLLSALTMIPLAGAVVLMLLPRQAKKLATPLAILFSTIALVVAVFAWVKFDVNSGAIQFVERHAWISSLSVDYFLGIDGLGLLMVMLTTLVTIGSILATNRKLQNATSYFSLMLFLETGLLGTFTALNFFHWFIFWELSLVPAFFLIKLWGGEGRTQAATQFFLYTMVGSIAMLLSFLAIYWAAGSFDFLELARLAQTGDLVNRINLRVGGWYGLTRDQLPLVIFGGVFLGLAVKVPLMPFHGWLPKTYAEAPTSTTMLLTGAMSKMGLYGFLRILLPLFPEQMRMVLTPLLWLAVLTIILSAYAAFAQRDLKRVFAYSSINHLGYCLLGIFAVVKFTEGDEPWNTEKAAALNGVLLQMFNHGLTASAIFCGIAFLENRSNGLRGINDFGGLRKVAPVFCGLMGISFFASLGLPGLNGFIGEFLIFKGSFALATWATALSVIGLLISAVFILTVIQKVFNGPLNAKWSVFPDLAWRERMILLPVIALMFLIGIYPQIIIGKINTTVMLMVEALKF